MSLDLCSVTDAIGKMHVRVIHLTLVALPLILIGSVISLGSLR